MLKVSEGKWDTVLVDQVSCSEGCDISAFEFSNKQFVDWPVKCTLQLVELDLVHPECGGKLSITQAKEGATV